MTNEQMAIIKVRAIAIKMEEAIKVLEKADEMSVQMWDWWDKTILHFTKDQYLEYTELYEKIQALNKKLKEIAE